MNEKFENETRPSLINQFGKFRLVLKHAFFGVPDRSYEHKIPERKVLSEKTPLHVQAVNQMLDKHEIDISLESSTLIEKQHQESVSHTDREVQKYRDAIYEARIARSFKTQEVKTVEDYSKKPHTAENVERCKQQRAFDRVGYGAHLMFGMFKQATNPYDAQFDTLGQGSRYDLEDMHYDMEKPPKP